jgi:hypothetical protein
MEYDEKIGLTTTASDVAVDACDPSPLQSILGNKVRR